MSWMSFDFACGKCQHEFHDLVQGRDGQPDACPSCKSSNGFTKLASALYVPTTIMVTYPGSKRHKAGYIHSHGDKPAEKGNSQISMYSPKKSKGVKK